MATPSLTAHPRTGIGRGAARKIKAQGNVPGIMYGKSVQPTNLQFDAKEVSKLLAHAASENVLVDVKLDGRVQLALLQEVQHHPLSRRVLHLDLHAVAENETLHAHVPIEPFGEPAGVKTGGGSLDQSLRSLDLECQPRALPAVIKVDVSGLKLGESIHVRDLQLPDGVKPKVDGAVTVFVVHAPTVAEAAPAADAAKGPEVLKEKKPADAKAGAAAGKAAAPAAKAPAKK
ncbi:MAG: 50S ribosomal protein L25 [Verrucomicrobia bacterium]|nr:50S ribosomal protein L25 [Verrucomicrobiota bacterium]